MGFGLAGPALLATDAAIAVIVNFAKVIFFGGLDALTPSLFLIALAMGLCTIPGTWVAAWIVKRTDIRVHTLFVEARSEEHKSELQSLMRISYTVFCLKTQKLYQ